MRDDGSPSRYRELPRFWRWVVISLTLAGIAIAVNQLFGLGNLYGMVVLDGVYLYALIAFTLSMVFVYLPAHARAPLDRVPWYDAVLFVLTIFGGLYCALQGNRIILEAWEFTAPLEARIIAFMMLGLILEAGRRAGGIAVFLIALCFALYPLFADRAPAMLAGISMDFPSLVSFHVFSEESVMGIPLRAFALLVFGFLLFGVVLLHTGGGKFFLEIGFAVLGWTSGGPAKVAIVSSALFGSLSGGTVSNVLTTGTMTIPAMKRVGFPSKTAAAMEACASTGGVLMPPVMGATAFVMATFLGIPYGGIVLAAIIPSLLFYFGLFAMADCIAASRGLSGIPRAELPKISDALRGGWHNALCFLLMIWILLVLKQEIYAPFYASVALLVANQLRPSTRLSLRQIAMMLEAAGRLLAELCAILCSVGLIVGSITITGVVGSITGDIIAMAGHQPILLLVLGAATSFVLGIGMTATAAYVLLAVILAPALISSNFDPLAAHMFLMYWGMISFITPPVALSAFAAATISGNRPMVVGWEAMRLGIPIYFIPFWFVMDPALLGQGTALEITSAVLLAMVGVGLIASAQQNYLMFFGRIGKGLPGFVARLLMFLGGIIIATPESQFLPITDVQMVLMGLGLLAVALLIAMLAGARPKLLGRTVVSEVTVPKEAQGSNGAET